ncbi:MAG: dihydrofolate reductase [Acidiferrobacterales bacterium]|nr:dihydrofolate reductase [Acidiferrobacterales bacterium]
MISIIAAMDENRLIGSNNDLPWHLPADLQRVKQLTTGHSIILGRKNYESIGRPLPGRKNIVITHNPGFEAPGCVVVNSIEAALEAAAGDDVFIFGGARIYEQMFDLAERMYLTKIHATFKGDTWFPEYDSTDWQEIEHQDFNADQKNPYDYSFITLEKKPLN